MRLSQHLVAAVHAGEMLRDQVLEEQVVAVAIVCGQADKAGQGAGHGNHAQHLRAGAAALGAEQQRQAERLVEHARKGMRGIDGDGREQRIDLALKVAVGKVAGVLAELFPLKQANALLAQLREELLVPAVILRGHKGVNLGSE